MNPENKAFWSPHPEDEYLAYLHGYAFKFPKLWGFLSKPQAISVS